MNNRSLSRGDAVVIGAAVLLFIASFLDAYTVDYSSMGGGKEGINAWKSDIFPVLPSVFLAGVLGAAAIALSRFTAQGREFGGLRLDQWGIGLSVTSAWAALWSLGGGGGADVGIGLILGFLATLVLAGAAVATPLVPALKTPLSAGGGNKPPAFNQAAYGAQPGYGYPSAPTAGGQQGYAPTQAAPAATAGADPNFQPFWFAVPAARPLYGEDGSPTPVAELAPGTWYLAVEQRGQALVAQTQDGRRGVLQDTSGIQRG
ncbi:DUF5336 domain-containing protein [Streptomyces hoynatensis]|uniref:Uncharacterized protein n=1 Tax=Streptomyces hoynatensis TaxID=1141874 RepID=A0A3A9ZEY5_9ACTN|nr:DUF5336 domain-containing protein [Streptomyces hoynatensis]RKN45856.1 hypothetical protein D7294_05295 [Streptomyces hoynatensis]